MTDHLKQNFKKDFLNRNDIAEKYSKFLTSLVTNHTISLNAPWGTGKSRLIKMMKENHLKKELIISYNAWEHDYTNDAFLSFMSNFFSQIKEENYLNEADEDLKNLKQIAFKTGKYIIPALIKGGMNLLIGSEAVKGLEEGSKEIFKNLKDIPEKVINDTFDLLDENKQSREQFTEELKTTVQKISEEHENKQLIIIIDELDRCKPTFAIELLENIKHLFEIEKIVFFIAVDKDQLSESLKVVYGASFDTKTYLQRFFDLDLHLNTKNMQNYFQHKIEELLEIKYTDYKLNIIFDFAIENFDLTLRDFERIISEIYFLKKFNNKDFDYDILIILFMIKYKFPNEYKIIWDNKSDVKNDLIPKITADQKNGSLFDFFNNLGIIIFVTSPASYKGPKLKDKTIEYIKFIEETL